MCCPRTSRISGSLSWVRSRPSNTMRPPVTLATVVGKRRMIEKAVMDFPDPLSPTSPTLPPAGTLSETWSTGVTVPSDVAISVVRLSRVSRSAIVSPSLVEPRVDRVVESVADEIEPDDGERDPEAGEDAHPPRFAQVGLRVVQHAAPGDEVGVAEPEKPEARLEQDR